MLELSLQTSFTTFCSRVTRYGPPSAGTLLVKNINSTSLLEVQDNNSINGRAFENLKIAKSYDWLTFSFFDKSIFVS